MLGDKIGFTYISLQYIRLNNNVFGRSSWLRNVYLLAVVWQSDVLLLLFNHFLKLKLLKSYALERCKGRGSLRYSKILKMTISISVQQSASIQPRTSLTKFGAPAPSGSNEQLCRLVKLELERDSGAVET